MISHHGNRVRFPGCALETHSFKGVTAISDCNIGSADNWLSYVTNVAGAEGGTERGGFAS